MADPVLTLEPQRASVPPGGQVSMTVTISNPGGIVEGYRLDVIGDAARWAEMVPTEVSVFPQEQATSTVVFSPPSGSEAPGGEFPFGVRAVSLVTEDASAVVEGDIEIARVFGLQAKIVPVTSTGRWRGRHVVRFSNWGNTSARLRLQASDPDAALGFLLRPDVVDLPVGAEAVVRVLVRTRRPKLRGTPARLPFQIVGERVDAPAAAPTPTYADPGRPVVDAALVQNPILTRGFVMVAAVLVVAVVTAAFGLTRQHQFEKLGAAPVVSPAPGASVSKPQVTATTGPPDSNPPSSPTGGTIPPTSNISSPPTSASSPPTSASSPPTSASSPPTSGSGSPTSSVSSFALLPDGSWVALSSADILGQTGESLGKAEKRVQELLAKNVPAVLVDTTTDQRLNANSGAPSNPAYVVLVGPFLTQVAAQAACSQVVTSPDDFCQTWVIASPTPSPQSS